MRSVRAPLIGFSLFAVASIALTWWIAGELRGRGPSDTYELSARFDDVAGLYSGDGVRLAGVPVGAVSGIEVAGEQAVVHFEVDEDVQLSEDSGVAVRWRNLIGERYLALRPGTGQGVLADGDEMTRVDDVVDLGRLVNQLSPLTQVVGPEQINRILTSLVTAFEGNEAAFDALVADLGSLTGALDERAALIGQLLADSATITEALAARDDQIAAMVSNLSAISNTIDATDRLVESALVEFARVADGTQQILSRTEADLGPLLQHLGVLSQTAVDNVGTIEQALRTFPAMLEEVLPAINRGPYLRVNLLCLTTGPGVCPHPLLFFEDEDAG
jgi:phospholipid/cholesterol/gamma-HCH transport system substrate-binding protein